MKKIKNTILVLTTVALIGLPILALAQETMGTPPVQSIQGVYNLLNKIVNLFFGFILLISVIFIFMAAFKYLSSAGDSTKIKEAQNQLIYAAVGIGVAFLAKGIVYIVANFLGTSVSL